MEILPTSSVSRIRVSFYLLPLIVRVYAPSCHAVDMPPYTANMTVGPGYPVVSYQFPSMDLHDEWFGMVQRARNFCSEKNSLWDEVSEDEMVVFFAEWFGIVERIVRDFGIKLLPPDLYCAAHNTNRTLESMRRPRMDAFDAVTSVPPRHAGCELVGIYDPSEFELGNRVPFQSPYQMD